MDPTALAAAALLIPFWVGAVTFMTRMAVAGRVAG